MSGIAGIFNRDGGAVRPAELDAMLAASAALGGDGTGQWVDGAIGLAAHNLWITPETQGEIQPLCADGLTIAFDGRLDDRENLISALGIPAAAARSSSDAILVLSAYRKWGEAAAEHLTGEFAFAIWDSARQQLYAARDITGVRPLYYYHAGSRFAFATEFKALFWLDGVEIEPDEDLILYIQNSNYRVFYHPARLPYKNTYRLPLAHAMTVNTAGVRVWEYWTPPTDQPVIRFDREETYFERLLELMATAVADRMRTSLKVGAHMSGGLDSSSVAILAQRRLKSRGETLETFSWSPPRIDVQDPVSEHYRLARIIEQEGMRLHYAPPPFDATKRFSEIHDRLQSEAGVAAAAQALGVRVMLSGWGGDEFASGNGRGWRAELFRSLRWRELVFGTLNWKRFPRGARENLALLWRDVVMTHAPDWMYARSLSERWHSVPSTVLLKPAIAAKLDAIKGDYRLVRYQEKTLRGTQRRAFYQAHLTERNERWALGGAPFGITYTFPLQDRRILEFVMRVPPYLFLSHGLKRWWFRKATAPLFPPDIMDRYDVNPKAEPSMIQHGFLLLEFVSRRRTVDQTGHRLDNPWVNIEKLLELQREYAHTRNRATEQAIITGSTLAGIWDEINDLRERIAEAKRTAQAKH